MAARSVARSARTSAPEGSTSTAAGEQKASLGVVDRRHLLARAQRRQGRVLLMVSGCIVAGSLAVAAGGQALLAATQIRADGLQAQVASALASQQNLRAARAQLETPSRVLTIAEQRFKMSAPAHVTYLQPVNPGESVAVAHAPVSHTASPAHGRSTHEHRQPSR